ncbi:acylphosphatase [Listeria welshimeri]|nr:acylphosphatase [Listeria welshimeri]MBC1651944.1 acylphosphatase [Listeria welshimeri]MBC1688867.1 acylphosphatase [Listeria welshimeri]
MARDTAILRVTGFVQGVGFRYTTKHVAYKYDISGTVKNLDDGSVEIHAIAEKENLNKFIDAIKKGPSPGCRIEHVYIYKGAPVEDRKTFDIVY